MTTRRLVRITLGAMALAGTAVSVTVSQAAPPGPHRITAPQQAGQPAPDFQLTTLDSSQTFRLSSNFGVRPTVLVFGSYT